MNVNTPQFWMYVAVQCFLRSAEFLRDTPTPGNAERACFDSRWAFSRVLWYQDASPLERSDRRLIGIFHKELSATVDEIEKIDSEYAKEFVPNMEGRHEALGMMLHGATSTELRSVFERLIEADKSPTLSAK